MSFVHIVTSILVDDSFFWSSFFCFNNTNTSVRSFIFFLLSTVSYISKGPLCKFQPGAPHYLNPPLLTTMEKWMRTSFNHRRSMKAETSRKIPQKHWTSVSQPFVFRGPLSETLNTMPPCSTNFLALPRKSFQKSASKRNKVVSTGLLVTLKETLFGPLGDHRTPLRNLALDLSRSANSTFRFHDWYHKSPQGFDIYMLLLWSTYLTVISNASHEGPQSQFVKCSKRNGADRLKTSS